MRGADCKGPAQEQQELRLHPEEAGATGRKERRPGAQDPEGRHNDGDGGRRDREIIVQREGRRCVTLGRLGSGEADDRAHTNESAQSVFDKQLGTLGPELSEVLPELQAEEAEAEEEVLERKQLGHDWEALRVAHRQPGLEGFKWQAK